MNMLIKGIIIGFMAIIIPTIIIFFSDRLKNWLEESATTLLLFNISITVFFIGFRINAWVENVVDGMKEVKPNTIEFIIKNIVSNGLLLVGVLFIIGWITRRIHKIASKKFNLVENKLKEADVEIIFIFATLTCILFSIATDGWQSMSYLSIIAILLGKVVWIDTTRNKLYQSIKELFTASPKSTIIGSLLLTIIAITMNVPLAIELQTAVGIWIGFVFSLACLTYIAIKKSITRKA